MLMLTVSEDEHDLSAALAPGRDGYLLKTIDSDDSQRVDPEGDDAASRSSAPR